MERTIKRMEASEAVEFLASLALRAAIESVFDKATYANDMVELSIAEILPVEFDVKVSLIVD